MTLEKILDDTNCLIRLREKSESRLYELFIKQAQRWDNNQCLLVHDNYQELQFMAQKLESSSWESFWRGYFLFRAYQQSLVNFPKVKKFSELKLILKSLSRENALLELATKLELQLVVKDAIYLVNEQARQNFKKLYFIYNTLGEDALEIGALKQQIFTGLFQFIQSCDAGRLTEIKFKIFLRECIWNTLIFDNKSHFTGRDVIF